LRLVPSCTRPSCPPGRKYLSSSSTRSPGHPRPTEKDSRLEPWPRTETRKERPQVRLPCSRQTPALAGVQNDVTACSGRRPSSPPSALPPHGALVVRALSIALEIRCASSQCQSESRKGAWPVLWAPSSTSSGGRALAVRFLETPSNAHRVRKGVPFGVGTNAPGAIWGSRSGVSAFTGIAGATARSPRLRQRSAANGKRQPRNATQATNSRSRG
jgi:hypothetical protein